VNNIYEEHIHRLKTSVLKRHTAASIAKWITENTTYAGQPYTYRDHEFQETIMSDTSPQVDVRKCSQVGLSEVGSRMSLALVNVLRPYTVAYTLPTAHFAGTFAKTRIDPIIQGSKVMRANIHRTNDNNEVKQFGDSFLYIRGAASSNAPISIPCDHLVHDEVDFSDQEVLGQYFSRLTHSPWKRTTRISTPTLPGFGISKSFDESRRHYNLCRCNHCNHWFQPDYYKHVQIPGYMGDLKSINKHSLTKLKWQEARVICPKCGMPPSLQKEHRQFVCENKDENYSGAGYQVTPFDAPNVIKVSDLIMASTKYDRRQDFDNFNLGIPAEDTEATLTRADFASIFVRMDPPGGCAYVMGVDVGSVYHFVVSAVDPWGDMLIVEKRQVPMGDAKKVYIELRQRYRVLCTVIDSAPHAETVMALQDMDPNCYAAVYTRNRTILTHVVIDKEEDADKGREFVRQVNINRNRALDAYMLYLREGHLRVINSEEDDTFIAHHMSMKRVKTYEAESGEMTYTWQKTDGVDHYHHSALYCWMAARIKGVGRSLVTLPVTSVMKFRLVDKRTQA
jgi:hypothetical protein